MAADCARFIQGCMMRIARLSASGTTPAGVGNMYVNSGFVRAAWSPVVREGIDIETPNACGDICGSFKDCDRTKWLAFSLDLCFPDPELTELIAGGEVLLDVADPVGWKMPELNVAPCSSGFSIEVWQKRELFGAIAAAGPYVRHVFPRILNMRPADREINNGPLVNSFVGIAIENPNWLNGPQNDWDYDSDRAWQYAIDDALPASVCGPQATPAQV